jgi:hypothetical protein
MADYTEQQLIGALRKADAAGDVAAAKAIARRIQSMRQSAPKADFSDVQSSVSMSQPDPTPGPLAPSIHGERSAPSLDAVNAQNRAYMASPQFAEDQAAAEASQMEARQRDFQAQPLPLRALVGAGGAVARNARGIGQLAGLVSPEQEAAARQNDQFMAGDTAATVGGVGGDLALMALPATRISRLAGAGRGAQLAANVTSGATLSGIQPVVDGESRTLNAAVGGGLSIAGTAAASGLQRLGASAANAIKPEVRALYEAAKARGISLTPTQLSDSRFLKFLESQLRSLPLSGAQSRSAAQRADWNRAVARTVGSDADAVTPEVYAASKARIGGEFNRLSEQNQLPIDDALLEKLVAVQQDASQLGDDATGRAVNSMIERLMSQADGGVLPGRAYQSFDSELGRLMKTGGEKSFYLGQIRDALRGSMDEAISPADRAAWQTARGQYKNLKTLRDIVPQDGGDISPAALRGRVMANQAGKEAAASGRAGELGLLAQIGQRMKEPQSSGTAERLWLLATGAGGLANLPGTLATLAAGNVTGRALNSPAVSSFLLREGRGQGTQALARMLKAGTPAAAPTAANEVNKERRSRKDKR